MSKAIARLFIYSVESQYNMTGRIVMIKQESKFILKCFNEDYSSDIAIKYIYKLFDIDIGYRLFLQKVQIILSNLDINDNNELISSNSTGNILREITEQFENPLNGKLVSLTIIKKLVRHNSIYEIRLDGGDIYPRILFFLFKEQSILTFGLTKRIETIGHDNILDKLNNFASESELIAKGISSSKKIEKNI